MERVRKSKAKPTLESVFFATPEQKLLRFLLSEPTTEFTPRVLSSRLKGVRGLGGIEGLNRILKSLQEVGLVDFVSNNRAVIVENDHMAIKLAKAMSAVCDLESLKELLLPESTHGILHGSRARGVCVTDSNYDLFVVSDFPTKIEQIVQRHPLGMKIELKVWRQDDYLQIEKRDASLAEKLSRGIVMWGNTGW